MVSKSVLAIITVNIVGARVTDWSRDDALCSLDIRLYIMWDTIAHHHITMASLHSRVLV